MTPPSISVLILNYNGLSHLKECFESLETQTFRDFEVVVVDNASRDGSREYIARHHPGYRLIESGSNLGFAGGNNLGLPHCRGRWVYFLNNDVRLDPRALEELSLAAGDHPDVKVFASLLLRYADPSRVDSAGDTMYWSGPTFSWNGYPASMFATIRPIASACAGAALYQRALLDRLGGFDEGFFLNFEDMDLSFRARHLGERILLVPGSKVFHKGSATLGGKKSPISIYYSERNLQLFVLKNFPLLSLLKFLPGLAFVKAARFIVCLRMGLLGPYFRGNAASLALVPAMLAKRRGILASSLLTRREFERPIRKRWLRERGLAALGRHLEVPFIHLGGG